MKKKCCIVGLGYIGLPTAALLADSGYQVLGFDLNERIIEKVNNGKTHIIERNLNKLVSKVVSEGNLIAKLQPSQADNFLITVPTPFRNDLKNSSNLPKPDLSYVFSAIDSIIPYLFKDNLIIIESTCPVGTTKEISEYIFKKTRFSKNELKLAYCPERVLPGNTLDELKNNDRVIGGITKASSEMASTLYSSFCNGALIQTDSDTAEFVKLTENSFRDVNIAFANELSIIADKMGLNIREVIRLANTQRRVDILQPSTGVGGHCIAVDPWFIASQYPDEALLIKSARKINDKKPDWVLKKIISTIKKLQVSKEIKNRKFNLGILGITFKPNVDDMRNSPALEVVNKLLETKFDYVIRINDPYVENFQNIKITPIDEVLEESDFIAVLVGHNDYKNIEFKDKYYYDFCGVTDK
tara:strand:- start:4127 stop:5365 length:1239 start_codon:yes stop_codon:yes gene_type:complete